MFEVLRRLIRARLLSSCAVLCCGPCLKPEPLDFCRRITRSTG